MCGGGSSSGPSEAEIAAREKAAADAATAKVEAEQAELAKKANDELIKGKQSAADAEAAAAAKQQSLLGSLSDEENKKKEQGKSTLLGG